MLKTLTADSSTKPLPTARDGAIILHEYRHDCSERNHQLLVNVTLEGFELICPRCRVENRDKARVIITWQEVLTMMLMAWRMRG